MEASREMLRRGTRRKASRIAARAEVTRIAGYRVLIRTPDQEGAALHNRAQDERRVATVTTNTQVIGGRNLYIACLMKTEPTSTQS